MLRRDTEGLLDSTITNHKISSESADSPSGWSKLWLLVITKKVRTLYCSHVDIADSKMNSHSIAIEDLVKRKEYEIYKMQRSNGTTFL